MSALALDLRESEISQEPLRVVIFWGQPFRFRIVCVHCVDSGMGNKKRGMSALALQRSSENQRSHKSLLSRQFLGPPFRCRITCVQYVDSGTQERTHGLTALRFLPPPCTCETALCSSSQVLQSLHGMFVSKLS